MSINTKKILLALILILALLAQAVPAALAAGTFEAVVIVDTMKVYDQKSPHGMIASLARGTLVTVFSVSGSAALINGGGVTGIVQVTDLSADTSAAEAQTLQTTAVVTLRKTRLYKRPSTASAYITVDKGTELELIAVNGNCARIRYEGKVGYAVYSHLGASQTPTPTPDPSDAPGSGADVTVRTGKAAVVTRRETRVYSEANTDSEFITVRKGTEMTLVAVKGVCGMVVLDGDIGYVYTGNLKLLSVESEDGAAPTAQPQATPTPTPTPASSNPFDRDSNQYVIYAYLTGEMGLNRAAAMGVLANIKYESAYKPTIVGDSGTSYGICQWHAGRKTNLINWCENNGLDYTTLDAQLRFLNYELTTRYPSVNKYIRGVANTADGAYDAGYYFCFNFEAPAARTSQSTARGNYAKNTLFPMK